MEKIWEAVRRNIIPTSATHQLESLKNLLGHFCDSEITFKSATVSNGTLNYVEVVKRGATVLQESNIPLPTAHPQTKSNKPKQTLILMHGFGSGLGFFFNNYDDLTKSFDKVIAVDWLGMGGSSRSSSVCNVPAPRLSVYEQVMSRAAISSSQRIPSTVAATDFFIDSLEEMRQLMIDDGTIDENESFHLAGHSLGAYLAAQYALKYSKNIKSLILISPVGLPEQPDRDIRAKSDQLSWGMYTASTAWLANVTPQTFVRMAGPKGLDLVKGVLDKRFGGRWSPTELDLISTYLYHISAAPALGEYSLNSLLEIITTTDKIPISADIKKNMKSENINQDLKQRKSKTFIYAREPLVDRLHELPKSLPVLVLFGDNDWLYNPADVINNNIRYLKNGRANDQNKNKSRSSLTEKKEVHERKNIEIIEKKSYDLKSMNNMNDDRNDHFTGIDITMQVIPGAGHHIYLDNAKGFTYSITSWLKLKGLL